MPPQSWSVEPQPNKFQSLLNDPRSDKFQSMSVDNRIDKAVGQAGNLFLSEENLEFSSLTQREKQSKFIFCKKNQIRIRMVVIRKESTRLTIFIWGK
jgi:hypothetical protein